MCLVAFWLTLNPCETIALLIVREKNMAKLAAEKPFSQAVKERRATPSFEDVPIHNADLEKIIRAGLEAPSGYNTQPWRFVVVRDRRAEKEAERGRFRTAQS